MSKAALPFWAVDRVFNLMHMTPQFRANVRFMLTEEGGRKGPVPNSFGCPCVLTNPAKEGNDARLLFDEDWTELGKATIASFFFTGGEEAAKRYREAGQFYLWEGKIVGEVKVL